MTTLILYNPNPRVLYQDYIDCASLAGLTCEAAEVHADSKTVWFKAATFDGKDLGLAPEPEWPEKGFFPAFTQRMRDFLGAKYDLPTEVNHDVVVPTRHPPSADRYPIIFKTEVDALGPDVLHFDAAI